MIQNPSTVDQTYVQQVLTQEGARRIAALLDLSQPTDTLELYVAIMTCLWGLWVGVWAFLASWCCPWSDLSEATNILNLTFTFLPQWGWGLIGTIVGAGHLCTRLQQIGLRRAWLVLSLMFWTAVTLTVVIRIPYSTGIIAYGGLAFASGLSYLRLYIIDTRLLAQRRKRPQEP